MTANLASSAGDTVIFDSSAPGGHRLKDHSSNATSLSKIVAGNWDYVVLQDQSQFPSFPIHQVEADVFPSARFLDSVINANNTCAETVFYNTWGRKNGDADNCAGWPVVCTYQGMDSMLTLRYGIMAEDNNAILSPVAQVWKYIRTNHPTIELYDADGSHPSLAGTYIAACAFYTVLFRKDPTLLTFNAGLLATTAETIRQAAKLIAYDNLSEWHVGEYDAKAGFGYSVSNNDEILITNSSTNADSYLWYFGDGDSSTSIAPTHAYNTTETYTYTVTLIAANCHSKDTTQLMVTFIPAGITENSLTSFSLFPNPASSTIMLQFNDALNTNYAIIDINGMLVKTGSTHAKLNVIDISELPRGVYMLRVSIGGVANNKVFIKQ